MLNIKKPLTYSALISCLFILGGCLSSPDGKPELIDDAAGKGNSADYSVLLKATIDNVIVPTYQTFSDQTSEWTKTESSIVAYCDSIDTENESQMLSVAKNEWQSAMAAWQTIESFQLGPV